MFDVNTHLMDLKGRAYLQVMWRLVWFRDEHPNWNIETAIQSLDIENGHAVFTCKICDENGVQKSSGYGSESIKDFRDYIEKAETKAVGRALAMLGYGTQFSPELDEGERIVDSPVKRRKAVPGIRCADCGAELEPVKKRDGEMWAPADMAAYSQKRFDRVLCPACMKKAEKA